MLLVTLGNGTVVPVTMIWMVVGFEVEVEVDTMDLDTVLVTGSSLEVKTVSVEVNSSVDDSTMVSVETERMVETEVDINTSVAVDVKDEVKVSDIISR